MPRTAVTIAVAVTLAAPVTARAGSVTIGSDLKAKATIAQSHPRDWAAWPAALDGGGKVVATARGEVATVKFKGTVLKAPRYDDHPPFNFRVGVLRPESDGRERLIVASKSLNHPFGGSKQQITTFKLQRFEARLCVRPGDHVALLTSGGFGNTDPAFGGFPDDFYADGHPVRMFARAPGSSVSVFEQPASGARDGDGLQVGDSVRARQRTEQELLMRAKIATGGSARPSCRSEAQQQGPAVRLPDQPRRLELNAAGKVAIQLECASPRACMGQVFLKHKGKPVGAAPFSLGGRGTGLVKVPVNANGMRLLKARGGTLRVSAIVRPKGGARTSGTFQLVR